MTCPSRRDRPRARIGVDEWVARADERTGAARRPARAARRAAPSSCRWWALLAVAVGVSALVPFISSSDYVIRVAVNTVLFALLALGLNVVVGWAGLLDLGYVAFYGFGAYLYAMLSSDQFGLHWPAERRGPARHRLVRAARPAARAALAAAARRLPRDRDALLRADLRRAGDERATGSRFRGTTARPTSPAGRTGSPISTRSASSATSSAPIAQLPLALARRLHGRRRRALLRQPLAHRPGVAGAARGPARGRADEHAREPAEAARVRVRRRDRRPDGDDLRLAVQLGVFPRQLRPAAADHDLRDGDPRRRRQPPRRRPRRDHDQRLARAAARAGERARALLRRDRARPAGAAAAVAEARRSSRSARSSSASSPTSSPMRSGPRGPPARSRAAASPTCSTAGSIHPVDSTHLGNAAFVAPDRRRCSRSRSCAASGARSCSCRRSTSPPSSGRTGSSTEPSVTRILLLGALLIVLMSWRPQGLLGTSRVEIV